MSERIANALIKHKTLRGRNKSDMDASDLWRKKSKKMCVLNLVLPKHFWASQNLNNPNETKRRTKHLRAIRGGIKNNATSAILTGACSQNMDVIRG